MNLSERRTLHSGIERRSIPFRLIDDGFVSRGAGGASTDGWTLAAHASVTGVSYTVHDRFGAFRETVRPGAFRDTIAAGPDTHLLTNHAGLSLARTRSGTLRLSEDATGLRYEADLDPSNPNAQALRSAVQRGDISESSFSFKVTRDKWDDAFENREIYSVDLDGGDVSACNFGANPFTGDPGSATTLRSPQRAKRKQLTSAEQDDLPDSAFAYIQPGGVKDKSFKTVPRSYRHFIIIDAAHVRNALARIGQGAKFGKEALPAVLKAAAKFGVKVSEAKSAGMLAELRSPPHANFTGTHSHRHSAFGSQGGDRSHSHSHTHNNDSTHDHHADDSANADVASSDAEDDDSTMATASSLSLLDHDAETRARITILRLRWPPEPGQRRSRQSNRVDVDRIIARRRAELKGIK